MPSKLVITVDTAAMLMEVSKRTLWRHLAENRYSQQPKDAQGRATILLQEVAQDFKVALVPGNGDPDTDDFALLALADQGEAHYQVDFAILLLEQEKLQMAIHWLSLAAESGHADAMHLLSGLYQQGRGVEQCEKTAMIWRSKAAAAGHKIALAQLDALR